MKIQSNINTKASPGFTLIELLIVISIIGVVLSLSLPISFDMYESYKASLKAQKVMLFISSLKRESFLYSEEKVISSNKGVMIIDGIEAPFEGIYITVLSPIVIYGNGTTSGGVINIQVSTQTYTLSLGAPLGDLFLTRKG